MLRYVFYIFFNLISVVSYRKFDFLNIIMALATDLIIIQIPVSVSSYPLISIVYIFKILSNILIWFFILFLFYFN